MAISVWEGTFEDVYCSSQSEGKIKLKGRKEVQPCMVGGW